MSNTDDSRPEDSPHLNDFIGTVVTDVQHGFVDVFCSEAPEHLKRLTIQSGTARKGDRVLIGYRPMPRFIGYTWTLLRVIPAIAIFYHSQKPQVGAVRVRIGSGQSTAHVFIRAEVFEGPFREDSDEEALIDALDAAKPRPGENVMNTHYFNREKA